jgi:hypothetical protein
MILSRAVVRRDGCTRRRLSSLRQTQFCTCTMHVQRLPTKALALCYYLAADVAGMGVETSRNTSHLPFTFLNTSV